MPTAENPDTGSRLRKHGEPTVTVSVKLPKSLATALALRATANRLNRSEAVNAAVRDWVANH